ncbi:MAG: endonuclease [Candidatus Cloacimonetes bacterium]|nr:endonuclease [Candidatus Cloacimonadota bacterium]
MKKYILLLLAFALFISLNADYYDSITDQNQEALLLALRNLISTNTYSNYSGAKVFLFQTLDNEDGVVRCIYTGEEYEIEPGYSGQTSPNTEHTYAQSWFSTPESSIKKADLHHLFICTMQVNSARSNYPFGVVASPAIADVYYPHTPWQSYRGNDNWQHRVFEPADQSKGDIARALMYFHVRYNDSLTQSNVNMIPTFRIWHQADPPTPAEISRNNAVQGFQGNRNPFVDHPEYVERIWGPVSNEDFVQNASPQLRIDSLYPNPFKESIQVIVDNPKASPAHIEIYNIRGEKVYQEAISGKENRFQWQARDQKGNKMKAGVYFIRVCDGETSVVSKVLYLQ